MTGQFWSRAASSEETTVDEEVTFCEQRVSIDDDGGANQLLGTYDGRDSKLLLLSILEELLDVVTDDDAGLAVELLEDTHDD
jgi:hypothetical protein